MFNERSDVKLDLLGPLDVSVVGHTAYVVLHIDRLLLTKSEKEVKTAIIIACIQYISKYCHYRQVALLTRFQYEELLWVRSVFEAIELKVEVLPEDDFRQPFFRSI